MSLVQLYVPVDVAHSTVEALAELQRIQFKDVSYPPIPPALIGS
jgi:V-type H+-transporting ATPase subunit a